MNTSLLKGACPYCGSRTKVRPASEIYAGRMNSGTWGNVLSCVNYPMCDAYVGMHAGTMTPKGSLANRELRDLRKRAHALFDAYAVEGDIVTRKQAYGIAGQWLGLNPFHIGEMRSGGCSHFIERFSELKEIFERQAEASDPQAVTRLREQLDGCGVLVAARYVFLDSQPGRLMASTVVVDAYPSQKWALRTLLSEYLAYAELKHDRQGRKKWLCKTTPLGAAVLGAPCMAMTLEAETV